MQDTQKLKIKLLENFDPEWLEDSEKEVTDVLNLRSAMERDVVLYPMIGFSNQNRARQNFKRKYFITIPCGIKAEIPEGYKLFVTPRPGLSSVHGLTILNAPGYFDSTYKDEIKLIIANLGKKKFIVPRGTKIAIGFLVPVDKFKLEF